MFELLHNALLNLDIEGRAALCAARTIAVLIVIILSIFADIAAKKILLNALGKIISRTESKWDDALLKRKVFNRLSHLVPALVIYLTAPIALTGHDVLVHTITTAAFIFMVFIAILALDALLSASLDIYESYNISREIPIKGFVQVLKIITYFMGGILLISIVIKKSPFYLLSGLGALTAVLMLVFKDVILGFVAGIQLTANRMIAQGDWVEMPKYGADGEVVEIALTTVKIQNWDKTITTIPAYSLISESFKNWRGMSESGGRRIKRAINIDMNTICYCTDDMIERFSKIQCLTSYIQGKRQEISEYNRNKAVDESVLINGRRLTNIGTFRAYIIEYLRQHPMINKDMTFIVRQLAPAEHGLPIEIYVFCRDKVWANYEAIQSDIFDHILAAVSEFDLKVYQDPTGHDFSKLKEQT